MFRHVLLRWPRASFAACLIAAVSVCGFFGCERKERVLDVRTPEGDVTVDRNIDTGEVEVDVNDKD